jgi:hypothetical protein
LGTPYLVEELAEPLLADHLFYRHSGGGLTLSGTVQSITDDTLTLTTESGQTVELSLDADTSYSRKSDAAAADVTTGSTVEVRLDFGAGVGRPTASADSSTPLGTASSVTVVP